MKRKRLLLQRNNSIKTFVFLCFLALLPTACDQKDSHASGTDISFDRAPIEIILNEGKSLPFAVEIADTPEKQARGLMYRTQMGQNEGMLFLYAPEKRISMWMANTYLSLDMVFIDKTGQIIQIEEHTKPLSPDIIGSLLPTTAVLELNAGTTERLGIKVGNKIVHPFFNVEK